MNMNARTPKGTPIITLKNWLRDNRSGITAFAAVVLLYGIFALFGAGCPIKFLSGISCGFYSYYWYYKLGNRLQANAPTYGLTFTESGTTVLLWFIVGAIACGIGPLYAMHILMKNTNALATAYNQAHGL